MRWEAGYLQPLTKPRQVQDICPRQDRQSQEERGTSQVHKCRHFLFTQAEKDISNFYPRPRPPSAQTPAWLRTRPARLPELSHTPGKPKQHFHGEVSAADGEGLEMHITCSPGGNPRAAYNVPQSPCFLLHRPQVRINCPRRLHLWNVSSRVSSSSLINLFSDAPRDAAARAPLAWRSTSTAASRGGSTNPAMGRTWCRATPGSPFIKGHSSRRVLHKPPSWHIQICEIYPWKEHIWGTNFHKYTKCASTCLTN